MSMASEQNPLIVFTPSGKRGRFPAGTPVLQAARSLGVDIDSVCGGRAICGRCQINIGEGEFAKHGITSSATHVNGVTQVEERYDRIRGLPAGRRLSCQTKIEGDLVVDVPPESQVHKQVVRKEADTRVIALDPATTLYYIEVEEPDMHKPSSDLERVYIALKEQWGIDHLSTDLNVLADLQKVLRKGEWKITCAVFSRNAGGGNKLAAIWPGFHDKLFGLAVDVGSTTVAMHLTNLSTGEVAASGGLMNPQIRFGEDLMSRVSYVMMNPGGEAEMTGAIREALQQLAESVATQAGISVTDILEVVLVGNPVMHHLFLGIDPVELGGAPFALADGMALTFPAREMGFKLNAGASAYILPCIAGHVGADAAAVALSEAPHESDEIMLCVDVGTNAEIILGSKQRLLACSSPTGPAFEGAQISCGQRAAPGAIERIRINPETLEPRYKVIGSDKWSDEDGFEDEIKATGVTGICGSGIIEAIAEMYLAGIINQDGLMDGTFAARSPRIEQYKRTFNYIIRQPADESNQPLIRVTQNDVRAIQMAKAALYAGVRLLMDKLEINEPRKIRLAGAFGSHIDMKYAMILGLIPDCDLARVQSAGNAAGTGARIALLNKAARDEVEHVVRRIEKIETAVEPMFQQHFVEAMAIPHKTANFVNLKKVQELPPIKTIAAADDEGGSRRRRRG
ncbi:ASKHA domain-containing protein [Aestuariivirga litoralis]|uniref:ASKHA domain-containing protein n=1 Tax=Aestuariivirga litoralis TaxID=2650924 RepID=UPI0018C4FB7C|nr:ASKHA domain-containing protein [Aestuariivirga litoralis]